MYGGRGLVEVIRTKSFHVNEMDSRLAYEIIIVQNVFFTFELLTVKKLLCKIIFV